MSEKTAFDFKSAEAFLKQAKEAYSKADIIECVAAIKMVAVALNLGDGSLKEAIK